MRGDTEWVEVRKNFKAYFDATRDSCNTAARWEECGQKELFNKWKCSELKAKYFTYFIDVFALPCMKFLRFYLPIFKEFE